MTEPQACSQAEPVLRADIVRTLRGFSLAVSFEMRREVLVLFGPSGSGKSLTLQALAGVDRPQGGRIVLGMEGDEQVLFDAEAGIDRKPQERRIGYVPQSLALFPHLSVRENVVYGLRLEPPAARAETAKRLLALMRLSDLADRRPRQLSGGQRQRVALARALAVEPRLLLLDEPFTALDGPTRRALGQELRRLHQERAVPVLLVTHDTDEAFALGDRIAVMDAGRILQIGPRETVFARPVSRRAAELVGIENVLRAVVRSADAEHVVVDWGQQALLVNRPGDGPTPAAGARVDLAIGASQLTVLKEEQEPAEGERANVVEVETVEAEMARDAMRLRLRALLPPPSRTASASESTPLELEIPAYAYYRLGLDGRSRFRVQLKPEWLHLMGSG